MFNRLLILVVFFVLVAPCLWIGSGSLFAQTQDASSGIPRTPDGHPDLTGFYDVATITPVERPADYGERLFLSDEEVAAMVQYEEQRNQQDLEPVDPNQSAPSVGGDTSPTNSYLERMTSARRFSIACYGPLWPGSAFYVWSQPIILRLRPAAIATSCILITQFII